MFYKVVKDNKVIDVLDKLVYLKWEPKHKIMVLCDENEAQAVLSSGKDDFYHERTLYKIPDGADVKYETVQIFDIDEREYRQLKMFNCKSINEVLDEYTMLLISEGVI